MLPRKPRWRRGHDDPQDARAAHEVPAEVQASEGGVGRKNPMPLAFERGRQQRENNVRQGVISHTKGSSPVCFRRDLLVGIGRLSVQPWIDLRHTAQIHRWTGDYAPKHPRWGSGVEDHESPRTTFAEMRPDWIDRAVRGPRQWRPSAHRFNGRPAAPEFSSRSTARCHGTSAGLPASRPGKPPARRLDCATHLLQRSFRTRASCWWPCSPSRSIGASGELGSGSTFMMSGIARRLTSAILAAKRTAFPCPSRATTSVGVTSPLGGHHRTWSRRSIRARCGRAVSAGIEPARASCIRTEVKPWSACVGFWLGHGGEEDIVFQIWEPASGRTRLEHELTRSTRPAIESAMAARLPPCGRLDLSRQHLRKARQEAKTSPRDVRRAR